MSNIILLGNASAHRGAADDILTLSGISQTSAGANRGDTTPNSGEIPEGEYIRKFDLGVREASRLLVDSSKFLMLMSRLKTVSAGDPEFKSLEERETWHRRYAITVAKQTPGSGDTVFETAADWTKAEFLTMLQSGRMARLKLGADFDAYGRFSLFGRTSYFGASESAPYFLVPNMQLAIPICWTKNADGDKVQDNGYIYVIIDDVVDATGDENGKYKLVKSSILSSEFTADFVNSLAANDKIFYGHAVPGYSMANQAANGGKLFKDARDLTNLPAAGSFVRREDRVRITGNAHPEGSGLPGNAYRYKLRSSLGYTQIWKQDLGMTNTARATELQNNRNLWKKYFADAMLQHKQDINQSLYFGVKSKTYDSKNRARRTTEGMIPYILGNGFIFKMNETKNLDDFTNDLYEYYHPENGMTQDTIFFCSSYFYNWLNGLASGFIANSFNVTGSSSFKVQGNVQVESRRKVEGFDITTIITPRGRINITEDINLDGTGIHLMSVGLTKVAWRPLSGNGVNRDTSIYVGVQSVENTGVDSRVDLIQTEGGFDFWYPEAHAIWKSKV